MISTGTMIRLGKVYGNLMVDVKCSNKKLEERARHIVMEATGCNRDDAIKALGQSQGNAKTAIVMILLSIPAEEAKSGLMTLTDTWPMRCRWMERKHDEWMIQN